MSNSLNSPRKRGGVPHAIPTCLCLFLLLAVRVQPACGTASFQNPKQAALDADLFKAIQENKEADVRALVEQGANVNARTEDGWPVVMLAVSRPSLLKYLLEQGADPNRPLRLTSSIVSSFFPHEMTALILAARTANAEAVQLLLANGGDVDATDANGQTAVHQLIGSPNPAAKVVPILKALLAHGADIRRKDREGMTPLLIAVERSSTEVILFLLDNGASLDDANMRGETALMLAAAHADRGGSIRETMALLKRLLGRGANKNLRDRSGRTAAQRAEKADQPEVAYLLRTGRMPGPPARVLPRPARRLLAVAKPILKLEGLSRHELWWWSDTQLMVVREAASTTPVARRTWQRYDLSTGRLTPETRLDTKAHSRALLSPDGRRYLFFGEDDRGSVWTLLDRDKDATQHSPVSQVVPDRFGDFVRPIEGRSWLRDSQHWVGIPSTLGQAPPVRVEVFGLDRPGEVREVNVTFPARKQTAFWQPEPSDLLGVSAIGQVLTIAGNNWNAPTRQADIYAFGLDKPVAAARKYSVRLPLKAGYAVELSPQGDQLAWLIHYEQGAKDIVELWVSRTDGSGMRGIGFAEVVPGRNYTKPYFVQWLPGGKRLSFVCQDMVYSVAVPSA